MKVLETILEFILALGRMFFRRNPKGGRQYCPQCGALLRADCPCSCCRGTNGSSPGSSGSPAGLEKPDIAATTVNGDADNGDGDGAISGDGAADNRTAVAINGEGAADNGTAGRMFGWLLIAVAVGRWLGAGY